MRIDKLKEMPHWSYSSLNCFLSCPLKYKFRYIDNAESERTGSCFPFGRAFHAALSELGRQDFDRTGNNGKKIKATEFFAQLPKKGQKNGTPGEIRHERSEVSVSSETAG